MKIYPEDWLDENRLRELANRVTGEANTVESEEWIPMAEEVLALRARLRALQEDRP